MNKSSAKQILTESISNLQQRRGKITMADVEAEVINNACLWILKDNAQYSASSYASAFIEAVSEIIPQYGQNESVAAQIGIPQNVMWDGMWDYLRDYFQKNHGKSIDDVETESEIFYSTSHKRYEHGMLISESEVERTININYVDDKEEIIVSIEPSLSPKKGYLINQSDTQIKYKGYDSEYLFTVDIDMFDGIEKFTLEMPERSLKIVYFE